MSHSAHCPLFGQPLDNDGRTHHIVHTLLERYARCITGLNLAVLFVGLQGRLCPLRREENHTVGLLVSLQVK